MFDIYTVHGALAMRFEVRILTWIVTNTFIQIIPYYNYRLNCQIGPKMEDSHTYFRQYA